tara:strand:+ start:280 stop:2187 length:1908 start_codon:yes stop_codon:yes gene_type:complete
MSLLITSSSQPGNTNNIGIAKPYQFRNNLRNPLIIKKDSEIAVESVKIERQDVIDYENPVKTSFWFGDRLAKTASYAEAIQYHIPTENEINEGLAPTDFAEEFKEEILKTAYSFHPEIKSTDIECNVVYNNNAFDGFQFKIPQVGSNPTSVVPPNGTPIALVNGSGEPNWDGTTLEAQSDDCHFQLQPEGSNGGPLSLHNGSLTFSTITVADTFVCGLARPFVEDERGDINTNFSNFASPFGLGDLDRDFYDYAVEVSDANGIRVFHSIPNEFSETTLSMEEVVYYQNTNGSFTADNGSNSSFVTGSPIPSASLGDITFEAAGEKMKISVSGNTVVEVVLVNASTKGQIPKPIGQTCWKLYPTVSFALNGDSCDITNYACRTSTTVHNNVPGNNWNSRCIQMVNYVEGAGAGTISGVGTLPPFKNALTWPTIVDTKDCYQPYEATDAAPAVATRGGTLRDYRGIQNNLIGESGKRYENIFIMGSSDRYLPQVVSNWQPNTARILGFPHLAINADSGITHGGGYHGASFASPSRPLTTSAQSTFIRVPTLTHETYNFGTGNPSKILFQLPKFDNAGNESGALFFQNNDKSFVDLNNTTDIRVTDLDIHFVRKSEKFATDLTGSSEVVFVVREKPKM